VVANGHVYPAADRRPWTTSYAQRALLFRNVGGRRFVETGAGAGPALATPRVARGLATGDLDDDGDVDLVVSTIDGPPLLAINDGGAAAGHWLTLALTGDPKQRCPDDAIGSTVFVTAGGVRHRAEVASGRGQISQSDLRIHVGLGRDTAVAAVEVRWANGPTVRYTVPRVDAAYAIDQRTGAVTAAGTVERK
jgi:enediyne biosynthesis protein E4